MAVPVNPLACWVSILVFLDQALKALARRPVAFLVGSFQSLFSWIKR